MPSKNAPAEIVAKLTGFAALAAHHALPAIFPYRGFACPAADMTAASAVRCSKRRAPPCPLLATVGARAQSD